LGVHTLARAVAVIFFADAVRRLTPDQPSSDPTIELSKGLKNRATICELLRT
jgi:hypothetical protein